MCAHCLSRYSNRMIYDIVENEKESVSVNCCIFAVCVSCRPRTGGHTSSAMVSISDSTTLKVRTHLRVFNQRQHTLTDELLTHVVLLSSDTEIKGDILFLGYYESEFDWSNETAKVKLPQLCGCSCFFYHS